jgi:phosphatidylglycerol---prolipoprotein diacylglyceryl transferase
MFVNNINPILFEIGTFEIRYYGLAYAIGILIILFLSINLAKKQNIKKEDIEDIIIWTIFGTILGARLFHIIFYNISFFINNPIDIFKIYNGGLSFHGGLFGGSISIYILSKIKKIQFLKITDILIIPISLALAIGRLANFTNHELYGKITNLKIGVEFNNEGVFRHPTQIYESIKNLIIFTILYQLKDKKTGFVSFMFIGLYGLFRFQIEFLKDMPTYLLNLTMGQWLCIPMIIISLIYFTNQYIIDKNEQKNSILSSRK